MLYCDAYFVSFISYWLTGNLCCFFLALLLVRGVAQVGACPCHSAGASAGMIGCRGFVDMHV